MGIYKHQRPTLKRLSDLCSSRHQSFRRVSANVLDFLPSFTPSPLECSFSHFCCCRVLLAVLVLLNKIIFQQSVMKKVSSKYILQWVVNYDLSGPNCLPSEILLWLWPPEVLYEVRCSCSENGTFRRASILAECYTSPKRQLTRVAEGRCYRTHGDRRFKLCGLLTCLWQNVFSPGFQFVLLCWVFFVFVVSIFFGWPVKIIFCWNYQLRISPMLRLGCYWGLLMLSQT